jgi:7-carboxy-7-deazaguanine synthase
MPLTLIKSNPDFKREKPADYNKTDYLSVAELFCNTIQGEGTQTGVPATFLRLQGCTLDCVWCDTSEVWRYGNIYHVDEIIQMLKDNDMFRKFNSGQHIILTGGSPLKQQDALANLLYRLRDNNVFPSVQIENECVIKPSDDMFELVNHWNNSPKLANSLMKENIRYKPDIIREVGKFNKSWFKFVISDISDWDEIQRDFLDTNLIQKHQIILMPEGQTQAELNVNRERIAELVCEKNVRFSDRLHVTIWDKKTGV